MSQGTTGSTKLMLIVWALAMIFIGYKSLTSHSNDSSQNDMMIDNAVLERIKPVGEVRIDSSNMVASAETTETAERSGEEIYNSKCAGCHTSGIMGAPKYASLSDWSSRIDLGLDKLTASAETTETAERSGEEIYNSKCAGCHTSGIMGAPKYASLSDWSSRIDLGLDKLTASAIAGKGGMPARGTCMDCSDDEIKVTVQYMLDSLE